MLPDDHILGQGRWICSGCGYVRSPEQVPYHPDGRRYSMCTWCLSRQRAQQLTTRALPEIDYMARVISDAELQAEAEAEANRQSAIIAELRRRWDTEPLPEWPSA